MIKKAEKIKINWKDLMTDLECLKFTPKSSADSKPKLVPAKYFNISRC